MDSFGALAHGGWWAVSCICLLVGVVPRREEVSFSLSVVETWRMGGPVEPNFGFGYPAFHHYWVRCFNYISRSSCDGWGDKVIKKWKHVDTNHILIAGELNGWVRRRQRPMVRIVSLSSWFLLLYMLWLWCLSVDQGLWTYVDFMVYCTWTTFWSMLLNSVLPFWIVVCPYSLYKFTMLCFPFPSLYILASPFRVYNHWLYLRMSPLVAWPEWLVRVGTKALQPLKG